MTLRAILDWANQDSTDDLNTRFRALFAKGIITGGVIVPVAGQLKISLQPFTALSYDGMLVSNDEATILDIPTDQTNVIAIYAKHQIGDPALLEVVVVEASAFNGFVDKEYYVVFGTVTTISPSTEVVETDISYSLRETQDKRARERIRGQIADISEAPTDPNFNVYGDLYIVGTTATPNLFAWDGTDWQNITGAAAVALALSIHQHNLDTALYPGDPAYLLGRLHVSNDQKDAALGSYGTPSLTNRYVTQSDPSIPTNTPNGGQAAALLGSDGTPSNTNRYITQDYPIAAPAILSNSGAIYSLLDISSYGPIYVGKGAVDSANAYFALMDYNENKGYLSSSGAPCKINAIYKSLYVKLDPSTDTLVDDYGFFQGANLWLGFDNPVDTSSRLVYGKRITLKTADHGYPILPTPTYEIINGTLLSTIANIKGRDFYDTVPTNEQNINLRKDLDNLSEYIGSVLETNVIAGDEDFIRLSPEYPVFEKNVGVDYAFSFENKTIAPPYLPSLYEYDNTTGTVHYFSPVDLSHILVGDLFIDAGGNRYEVWAIGTLGTYTLQIKEIGSVPPIYPDSIEGAGTLISTSVDGSVIHLSVLTFKNLGTITGLPVSITWDSTNNRVQYNAEVNLSTVNVGDLFRDGGGTKYLITAVDDLNNRISIVTIETGLPPLSINTSVGSYLDGSTWINNNPRNILLSEMKFNYGPEFIPIRRLIRKVDEYSLPENQVTYGIERFDGRFDPRITFYGSWENYTNYTTGTGETYVRNTDGYGKFQLSGYFTDAFIVMKRKPYSGTIAIKINGISSATVDPTVSHTVSSAVGNLSGPKFQLVKLNSTALSSSLPTTITGTLPSSASVDSFDVYGFIFLRNSTTALLESGRAFESAHIIKRDMSDGNIPVDVMPSQGRGGRLIYAIDTNTYSRVISNLYDMDANNIPMGTWTGTTITITSSGGKLPYYSINDIIMVYKSTAPSDARICRISAIDLALNTITVDYTPAISGETVNLLHICSTDSSLSLSTQEDQIARYILPDDFIRHTPTDLELPTQSDRFVVGPDNLTILAGQAILITDSNIIGSKKAVQIQQGSSGYLQFTVLATRLDLVCVNSVASDIYVSIDGSAEYTYSISAMAQKRTIFSNARYQSHEVKIRVKSIGGTFSIAEMILYGPAKPEFSSFPNIVADLLQVASYQPSSSLLSTTLRYLYPTGAVFKEATTNLSYINGSGTGSNWSVAFDFTKAINYGYYVSSDKDGSYIEFYIENSAFELQYITGPDHGFFNIYIDGVHLWDYWTTVGPDQKIGTYTANGVDGYSVGYGRKNIGIFSDTFLNNGLHKITARVNRSLKTGSGYIMAFTGFYEGNNNGLMTYGINKYGVYSSIIDTRLFNPLAFPIEGTQVTGPLTRAAKVNLNIGTTSVVVTLSNPYVDSNYIITPCMMNTVDTYPLLQPMIVTAQSGTGFTITWNIPLPNGNYSLHYFTQTLDV